MNLRWGYIVLLLGFSRCFASSSQELRHDLYVEFFREVLDNSLNRLKLTNYIQRGVDVNYLLTRAEAAINFSGAAIHFASSRGHIDTLYLLLGAKVDINAVDGKGFTALMWAAWTGGSVCLETLINAKADLDLQENNGGTALMLCCTDSEERYTSLWLLLDAKARTDILDKYGRTVLYYAASNGHKRSLRALIEAKADVNVLSNEGLTPLLVAAKKGRTDCVKELIKAGANVNVRSRDGITALSYAATEGHTDCVEALIKAKADTALRDNETGNFTALHRAFGRGYIPCAKVLIKHSYDLFAPSKETVSQSRKRIFNVLLLFTRQRNEHSELDNLKSESLQFEILSWDNLLQKDLGIILLDELKKGKKITSALLICSKDAAADYLLEMLKDIKPRIDARHQGNLTPEMDSLSDTTKIEENFGPLVREGLNERLNEMKKTGI